MLRRLAHPRPDDPETGPVSVVVAPVRSVLQPQVKGLGHWSRLCCGLGQSADLGRIVEALAAAAYSRVELVEKRGEFAVRGGILDVFPPTEEHPLRVEFWGDDVEEIRYFKVADQRSLEVADHGLWAPPCRELLLTDEVRRRPGSPRNTPSWANCSARSPRASPWKAWNDWLRSSSTTWNCCSTSCPRARWPSSATRSGCGRGPRTWWRPRRSSCRRPGRRRPGGEAPIDVGAASLWAIADVRDRARELDMMWWSVSPFAADDELDADTLKLGMHAPETYRGDTARALADTKGWLADGWRTVYVTEAHGPAARTVEVLGGEGIAARLDAELTELTPAVVQVACGSIDYGFVDPALKLAVLTETDLSGQ